MSKLGKLGWSPGDWTDYGGAHDTPWGPRLSSYCMNTQEWREAFLERLVAVGQPGLFEAAARVYDLLAEPKGYHCSMIAMAAGVSGGGKLAILNTLKAFLEEWLHAPAPLDPARPGQMLGDWHAVAVRLWASEHEREGWVVKKFAAALEGQVLEARSERKMPSENVISWNGDPIT